MIGYDGAGLSLNGMAKGKLAIVTENGLAGLSDQPIMFESDNIGWSVFKASGNIVVKDAATGQTKRVIPTGTIFRVYKSAGPQLVSPQKGYVFIEIAPEGKGEYWGAFVKAYPPKNMEAWLADMSPTGSLNNRIGWALETLNATKLTSTQIATEAGGGGASTPVTQDSASDGEQGGTKEPTQEDDSKSDTQNQSSDNDNGSGGFPWLLLAGAIVGAKVNLIAGAALAAMSLVKKEKE